MLYEPLCLPIPLVRACFSGPGETRQADAGKKDHSELPQHVFEPRKPCRSLYRLLDFETCSVAFSRLRLGEKVKNVVPPQDVEDPCLHQPDEASRLDSRGVTDYLQSWPQWDQPTPTQGRSSPQHHQNVEELLDFLNLPPFDLPNALDSSFYDASSTQMLDDNVLALQNCSDLYPLQPELNQDWMPTSSAPVYHSSNAMTVGGLYQSVPDIAFDHHSSTFSSHQPTFNQHYPLSDQGQPPVPSAPSASPIQSNSNSNASTARTQGSPSSTGDSTSEPTKASRKNKNTEAARRYRQRKVDKVSDLEEALMAMTRERDELKLKLARAEAEAQVLREMVGRG